MPYRVYFQNAAGDMEDMGDRVQAGSLELVTHAEQGTVGSCSMVIDDTAASFVISGHRKVYVQEADAIADDHEGIVYVGYSAGLEAYRGVKYVQAERLWTLKLVDLNTIIDRRIMEGADAKRPAETDVQRAQWLIATNEMSLVDSDLYLSTADPVPMDDGDLRGQTVRQIWDDMAQQSGKNFFLLQIPLGEPDPTSGFTMWYGADDPETVTALTSPLRISNVLSDTDDTITFKAAYDSRLTRDPSRVFSGAHVNYDGGFVYVNRPDTATAFAIGGRDTTISAPNVKTKTKAIARGRRILNDIATEEDHISTAIIVPSSLVNGVMPGDRIQVKFSHFSGYESFTWMRVVNRTVRDLFEGFYELALELSARTPAAPTLPVYGILRLTKGSGNGPVYLQATGDPQPPGYPRQPTTGLIEAIQWASPPNAGWPYRGWKMLGTGTVDVRFFATTVGVLVGGVNYLITWSIVKNGVDVQLDSRNEFIPSGLAFYRDSATLTITGLAVATDDIIEARLVCIPNMPFFRTPAGTGQVGERLEITGGSLS